MLLCHFTQSKFSVGEYEGQVLPELALSVPVPFDFIVFVDISKTDLSSELSITHSYVDIVVCI